ncbi:MAG: FAD-binding oxidoreductase, partial [Candidatus Methylomirabilales bacterium]
MGAQIIKACIEMGGSLTGEHGIGVEKRDYMPLMYSVDDMEAMLKVKRVFNPQDLLNPGKVFPTAKAYAAAGPGGQRDIFEKVLGRV